ncbi:MAG: carbohydrate binding domain-containing protein, partial [Clostridia bacterium]|nr:carbohydrate binding domain-containing protein [Clostridia bacterium]
MMKNSKRNFIIAILACLCTACIALGTARFTPVKAEEYRTVSTYDFEDDSTAGWGNNNNCTFEISSEAYAGEKSLKSTLIDGKTQNRIQRQFAVGEGETFKEGYHYVFTFYAKSSVDSAIEGWFYVYDDKGGTTSLKFSATTTAAAKLTEEWKKYSFAITMEVVDGAVKAGRIWTDSVNYSYGTGTNNGATKVTSFNMVLFCNAQVWYMDDFIVSTDEPETPVAPVTPDPVPEGHRIVTESSFEDDSSAGWFNNGFSTHEISSDAYIGEKSLKSTLKAGETQNRIQRTFAVGNGELIQEGNTYTFSLYAKSSAASGIEGFFYIYDDAEGTTTVKFSAPTDADAYLTSEWKKYTYSLIMGVEDGAVTGRRVWTDGSDYAFSGSSNGATKVTSFNMLLFCDAEEWYMDEFRITTD